MILRFMRPDGSDKRDIIAFFGGQGVINVNSWAPTATASPMSPIRCRDEPYLSLPNRLFSLCTGL
ncbi:MAG: hypothetical protein MO852_07155, partial [Candidatus Devosia euplotis]|nr:hypothetical protein [Candidatus Devosia euplotis]